MGLSPDLFKRLSRLNRDRLLTQFKTGERAASAAGQEAPAGPPEADLALEQVVPGGVAEAAGGRFYRVLRKAEDFRPGPERAASEEAGVDGATVMARYRRTFFGAAIRTASGAIDEALRPLLACDPRRITYLDIETCGLSGVPLFLVGLMRYRDETLSVEQLLARDYSEERSVLAATRQVLAQTLCLVTFNGKWFDVPFVAMRSTACGLFEEVAVPDHVDLLHASRRRWKGDLPNCRLQTLEQLICGRRRLGDIPGSEIPAAYHEFVRAHQDTDPARRSRSVRCMQTILHHNALDLVTMAELVVAMLTGGEA
jgi:uncharacterized protein YprB with RNaseH-like and TPR domain